ncbi:MAG TPA: Gfo/Idh/MocA family oxidoreductase [Planctomycetaceae bacterium]|nr:Gfo/Idh/MocA family oxidoreductase [Planctomycetaceae bacterium]
MIRIGMIGIGFMGMTHYEASNRLETDKATGLRKFVGSKLRGAKLVAIAEPVQERLDGDWTSIQGNFGPRGSRMDLSHLRRYSDYQELLADPEIDLVDVCVPTEYHEPVTLDAVRAGKHVFVEKPLSIDLAAAKRMVRAAERAGVMLMVGHVLPFFPEFAFIVECVQSGKYGRLLAAHFRRVITVPWWSETVADFRRVGGWGIDLHIHDNHLIRYLCGMPRQVFARGRIDDGYLNHTQTIYVYDEPDLAISAVSGGLAARGLEFAHGYELYFEKATVLFHAGTIAGEWCVDRPLTVLTADGKVRHPKPKGGTEWCSAFTAELQQAVNGVKAGQEPEGLSGRLALDALRLCYAEKKSIETGRPQRP